MKNTFLIHELLTSIFTLHAGRTINDIKTDTFFFLILSVRLTIIIASFAATVDQDQTAYFVQSGYLIYAVCLAEETESKKP